MGIFLLWIDFFLKKKIQGTDIFSALGIFGWVDFSVPITPIGTIVMNQFKKISIYKKDKTPYHSIDWVLYKAILDIYVLKKLLGLRSSSLWHGQSSFAKVCLLVH